jgi:hypothetical protein
MPLASYLVFWAPLADFTARERRTGRWANMHGKASRQVNGTLRFDYKDKDVVTKRWGVRS